MAETKLDDIDIANIHIDDYVFVCKNRKSKRKSGDVGMFIKTYMYLMNRKHI